MLAKISSKHQIVIPKQICALFGLTKGDFVDFRISGKKIIMEPKEIIIKDKYPLSDLKAAEKVLEKGKADKETVFKSGNELLQHFKKRTKKK
jgi:AbrB family looped-hinge helix DNA binding protein